jgi:hypothetical protein
MNDAELWREAKLLASCQAQIVLLRRENERLRAALELFRSLKWKSIDKDNMEFECRTTYLVIDRINAARANKETK